MALLVDSEAQFLLRLEQCKVPASLAAALRLAGITTISSLAYSYGQPGQQIDSNDFRTWAEREARLNKLKTRLNGILIEGNTEPGHSFLDAVCNMHETNQLKYFPPEKCVSRLHELTNQKTPGKTIEVESSKLVLKDKAEEYEVSATTSLQILEAFKRRGLALDFA
ncbi:unnamed protein product, partial [Durusdinium trenchii]